MTGILPAAAHPARPKVAFVDLHLAGEGLALGRGQRHHPRPQPGVKQVRRVPVHAGQSRRGQRADIGAIQPQQVPQLALGNARPENIFVLHWLSSAYGVLHPLS